MKWFICVVVAAMAVPVVATDSIAVLVDNQNWADEVANYSDAIQNYGGIVMDESTTWWLTGPPDADAGHDFVAGWRSDAPNEYIVMHWTTPLDDRPGNDLVIRMYGGLKASADVLASVDGETYLGIGTLSGDALYTFQTQSFDFDGRLGDGIAYVKVPRVGNGPQTGMFFDAFGSVVLSTLIPGDANDDKVVDQFDALSLAEHWGAGNATWEMGDFNGDDVVGPADAAILAANWDHGVEQTASTLPEPGSTAILAIGAGILAVFSRRFHNPTSR
ncbi:MAG: hypothetical protein JW719_03570 [Pirellulales bacterium]|nr:hypothetical protein [Pirellulales bacterium]